MASTANTFIYTTQRKELTSAEDVKINLSTDYNRKCNAELEQSIQTIWNKRLLELPNMFNGTKFRLHSIEEKGANIQLNMGITCYRDFQGTNLSSDVLVLQSRALCEHDDSQAFMSDALGVGALVLTTDDHVVLLYRSKNCGEDINLWDRPGGHPEPKVIVGKIAMEDIDIASMDPEAVRAELFNSPVEEVISEVNIPANVLEPACLLGFHRSNLNGGKPNAEFLVRCNITAAEVEKLYKQGNQEEAFESEQIMTLPLTQALNIEIENPKLWARMAAGAKGVLTLYKTYKHRFP